MFSLVLKIALSFFLGLPVSFASEGAAKEAAPEEPKNKSDEESFIVIQARVAALEAKVHSGETEIAKLVAEKQHTNNPEKLNEIIRQMLTVHKEIKQNAKEYDQQRALIRYRYPEKGANEKRQYERIQVKSLEEMESEINLSSSLSRTFKKVRSQYPSKLNDKGNQNTSKAGASTTVIHKKETPVKSTPSLTDPIILKK